MLPPALHPLETLTDDNDRQLVDISYAPAQQLLAVRWFGNLTARQVIYVARHTLELRDKTPYQLLLNDKRNATGDWSEALDWLEYEWLPQVMASGLLAIAYVFTPDMHNQLASYRFIERLVPHIHIQAFYDLPTAMEWLSQQAYPTTA